MKREKIKKELSQEDFNKLLKTCKRTKIIVLRNRRSGSSREIVNVTTDGKKVYLEIREPSRKIIYYTRLDQDSDTTQVIPPDVWSKLIKLCGKDKIVDLRNQYGYKLITYGTKGDTKVLWDIACPGGYHYHNDKYINQYIEDAYGYDINSSYSYAMTKDMPDTSVPPRIYSKVNSNEIGFNKDGSVCLSGWAEFVFPLIKSPFIPFVDKYYALKVKYAKTKKKVAYKQILNIPTGYVQRLNPFLRNAIIYYAKEYVKQYIDKNTLYVNTDSIVSRVPRPDIPVDDFELGKFKLDHTGTFMYWGQGQYEWNGEKHNQGIPLYILNNGGVMKYRFDEEKLEVVENGINE